MSEPEKVPDGVDGLDAELARLDGDIAAADAGANPTPEAAAVPEAEAGVPMVSEVEELAGILFVVASLTFPLFPSLIAIYTPETCHALAGGIVPVMRKRGWTVAGITAGWGEEIALAIIVLPLGFATYQAVKADLAAMRAAEKRKAEEEEKARTGGAQGSAGDAEVIGGMTLRVG